MQKRTLVSLAMIVAVALPALAQADAKTFRVRKDGGSKVTFTSDAPLETMQGVSSVVTGKIMFDPDDLSTVKGTLTVPVETLRTGVDLRDEHLRGKNWLDAEKNPDIVFEITKVTGATKLQVNKDTKVKVEGKFTVHGITRPVTAEATVKWIPLTEELKGTPGIDNDVLRVKATFPVKLTDHLISVPAVVRLKVSNDITVEVSLRAIAE